MSAYITNYETKIINPNNVDTWLIALKNTSEIVANILSCNTSMQQIISARFKIIKNNGATIYSPIFPYDGTYPISFSFGLARSEFRYDSAGSYDAIYVTQEVQVASGDWWGQEGWTVLRYREYEKPSASLVVSRDEADNTQANFSISANVFPIPNLYNSEMNSLTYKMQVLLENVWTDITSFITSGTLSFNDIISNILPYSTELSYKTRFVIKDLIYEVYAYDTLPTSSIVMTWGKDGAGFGKRWERGAIDMFGDFWKNNILQPTIFKKKPSDPNPDNMEDGDVLIVYNDVEAFSSANFPQEFGTGYVWGQTGVWPTLYAYWTSMSSSSNPMIESFECSAFKGDGYPILMFDGIKSTDPGAYANGFFIPLESAPVTIVFKFNGKVQFNSFALNGWGQDHESKNSPKSFVFFGSNDGHTWDTLYDTTSFEDSWKTTKTANMLNSGNYYEYLKMVFRSNQDDNAGVNGSMIAIGELSFNCSGYKYV